MTPDFDSDSEATLRRLEDRLDRATVAAERLAAEAAAQARAGAARLTERVKPPASGWQIPAREDDAGATGATGAAGDELERIFALLRGARELVPPDLQQRLAEALKQLLLAIRALVDWYLERLEQRRAEPVDVQDIPVL